MTSAGVLLWFEHVGRPTNRAGSARHVRDPGTYALISGMDGGPSPQWNTGTLGYLGFLGLVVSARL